VTIKNQDTESSSSSSQNIPTNNKEEVNMKKLVLITLLGLCSLVFAQNEFSDDIVAMSHNTILTPSISERQIECLAKNMYFEAKSEPIEGIKAVGFVTMNRVADSDFPKTICEVVYQKNGKTCQFSWVCLPSHNKVIRDRVSYDKIYELARAIAISQFHDNDFDPTRGSLFFHATYVKPVWSSRMKRKVKIGAHIFYSKGKQ